MKICIVSDSHDRADALAQAVRGLPIHLIHGNNFGDTQTLHRQSRASGGLLQ